MSPGGSIVASFEYVESFFAVHTPPDHLIRTNFKQEEVIPEVVFDIFEKLVFLLGCHSIDNEVPRIVVCEICKPWGTINTKSNRSKSFERKSFCDFLVLEFILMRVLKSGEMIGGQILCSFFVSDDNIKFLEQKDPPHQTWLNILFSEEILYSRMVGIHYAFGQNEI
ncbi:hypothetical protein Tco_0030785 [Tanacetum coccineum]